VATTEQRLAALEAQMARILTAFAAAMGGTGGAASNGASHGGGSAAASDDECLGRYGNPKVKKDPKRWTGDTCIGLSFSEAPPEFLDCLADFLEWSVGRDREKPDARKHTNGKFFWQFDERDARLARGWARRIRAGLVEQTETGDGGGYESGFGGGASEDELPFIVNMTLSGSLRP
jgi:hypothetical protein